MAEVGRQRQGRVEIKKKNTISYRALLVNADELGSGAGKEIGVEEKGGRGER